MFGHRFYGARFYGPRYFGPAGAVVVVTASTGPIRMVQTVTLAARATGSAGSGAGLSGLITGGGRMSGASDVEVEE